MTREGFDVAVVGGGPAGATLAAKVATYGYRVCLLERGERARHHVGESLPASIHTILNELGLRLETAEVGMARPPRHVVVWGSAEPQLASFEPSSSPGNGSSSLLVWRGPFDHMLQQAARERGVDLRLGALVLSVDRQGRGGNTEVEIGYREAGAGEKKLVARLVADASGRSGVVARFFRRRETAFRTVALTGHWATRDPTRTTLVEAFPRGWVWSAPLQRGLRDVTIMVNPEDLRGDRKKDYLSHLAEAPFASSLLKDGALVDSPRIIDATPYTAHRFAHRDFILVGDAASFLDPLSAHGVHKAMDSALTAAVVARTILERPQAWRDAVEFYERREAAIYRLTQLRLGQLYRQESRWADEAFWKKRQSIGESEWPPPLPRSGPPFRGEKRFRPAAGSRLVRAPVLEGDFIERREVLIRAGEPVRYLGPVCLPELFKRATDGRTAAEAARGASVGFQSAFEALEWLYLSGYLEER